MARGGTSGDWLLLGELFARGERGFVDALRASDYADALGKFAPKWIADPRPEDEGIRAMDSNPPNIYGYGHEGYYRNVLAVLRGDAQPETDGRAGRKSLELILGIYESARTGRDVPLPLKA